MKDTKEDIKDIHSNTSAMNDDTDTGASLERFKERLQQYPKKKKENILNKEEIVDKYKGKVDVYKPKHVGIGEEKNKKKDIPRVENKEKKVTDISKVNSKVDKKSEIKDKKADVKDLVTKNKKPEKEKSISNKGTYVGIITRKDISGLSDDDKDKRINELEKEILLGLNTKLEREISGLKELVKEENEIVDTLNNKELISKEEIKEKIGRLEEILKKIREYIEQVEVLNNNYRFEDIINLTEFKDQNLINNIIEYRDILGSNADRSKELTDKYKMLDKFVLLYREVYVKEELLKHNYEKANTKLEKVEDRDKKYDKLKDDINIIEQVDKDCKVIIDKQNEYLNALNSRISKIDSKMVTQYRFNGINNLLTTMLMYISIMNRMKSKNPAVKGAISIAATRRMFRNLSRNRLVAVSKTEYSADDLSNELYNHLDDIEILSVFVDNALSDIYIMREQFNNEFRGKVPGYEELEKKLNEVEMSIVDNKKKLETVQKDINRNIEINDNRLLRVRRLNQEGV